MRKFVLFLSFIIIFIVPVISHGFGLEIAGGAWYQYPDGNFSFDEVTDNDDLDLEDDLNYDNKWQPLGRLKIDMPSFIPNLYLMYTSMNWDESGSKNVNFRFGDQTFNANVEFDSDLTMNHLDAALFYGLPFIGAASDDILNIELGLNVRLIDFEAQIEQNATGLKESFDYLLPIPMIYAGMQIKPFQYMALEFEGRGIAYSSNSYISLIGRLKVKPFELVFVAGGFRYDNVKIDYKDVDVDATFYGPFAEVGLEF